MSDIGYRIKVYYDIRYNVGVCSVQSDIGSSDIQLSPISPIAEIGLSAHLCPLINKCCRTSCCACFHMSIFPKLRISTYGRAEKTAPEPKPWVSGPTNVCGDKHHKTRFQRDLTVSGISIFLHKTTLEQMLRFISICIYIYIYIDIYI